MANLAQPDGGINASIFELASRQDDHFERAKVYLGDSHLVGENQVGEECLVDEFPLFDDDHFVSAIEGLHFGPDVTHDVRFLFHLVHSAWNHFKRGN